MPKHQTVSNKLKKVLFFTNGLVGLGGQERVLLEAATYFQKKKKLNVTVACIALNKTILKSYSHLKVNELSAFSYFDRIKLLRKYLKQTKPDLVICSSSLDCSYLYLASLGLNIPYISYIHGSLFWLENEELKYSFIHKSVFKQIRESVAGHKEFVPKQIKRSFKKRSFNNFAAIVDYLAVNRARELIVLTKQIKWEVERLYNRHPVIVRGCLDKSLLSYKAKLDLKKKYKIPKKTKIIMSVGRLDPRKRVDVLIKSFLNLCDTHKNIMLLIGGKGPHKEELEKIVNKSKHKEKIKFLGFVPDKEYYDHLAGCDIFAFPSWTTSGIPPYEALALGKKVVWTTEAEEPVLTHPLVFLADPTVKDFTRELDAALTTTVKEKAPQSLKEHVWEVYFEKLHQIAKHCIY